MNLSTKPLLQLPQWPREQPFSQIYHQNLSWNLHVWHLVTTHKLIVVAPGWPMIHWFWGSSESINQTSITATSLASGTAIQSDVPSKSVVLEPSGVAPRYHSESLKSFSEQVAEKINSPQTPLSRKLYG